MNWLRLPPDATLVLLLGMPVGKAAETVCLDGPLTFCVPKTSDAVSENRRRSAP